MANLDETFDIDHRTAAFELHERGLLVCLAGPGTGKTTSLLARTSTLTARGCHPKAICYLTFIRAISDAFVDDYSQRFGAEALESGPRIATLHSFACRSLRNLGFRIGYDGPLHFANVAEKDDASDTFLGDLLPLVNCDGCRTIPQTRQHLRSIKRAWRDVTDPAALPEPTPAVLSAACTLLRCYRLVDWDQAIPLAHGILGDLGDLPDWIANIKHYYVDEYQDFNRAEQAVIGFLASRAESMVVVGDDDQSLYSGRGGSAEGIRNMYADEANDRVSLVKCYRCPDGIVAPINTFQAKMSATAKPMTAARAGGEVLCYRFKSSKAEVAFLVEYLKSRIAELPEELRSKDGMVCLFPSNQVLNAYFDMLSPHLPCIRRHVDVPSSRLLMERILEATLNPGQRFFERLLLNEYGDVKPRHRKHIVQRILERDVSPSAACSSLINDGTLSGAALVAASEFILACGAIEARKLADIAQLLSAKTGATIDLLNHHIGLLLEAGGGEATDQIPTICDTLLPATAATPVDMRAVQFLTIHSSKGLTKRTVVLPGLEHACLPGEAVEEDLAERQRLFFVALSRATDRVLLTFPHNRGGNDSLNFAMAGRGAASPFLKQAGIAAVYHS